MPALLFPVAPAIREALTLEERLDAPLSVFGPTDRFHALACSQGWATPRDLVVAGPSAVASIVRRRRGSPEDATDIRNRIEAWLGCRWEDALPSAAAASRNRRSAEGDVDRRVLEGPLTALPLQPAILRIAERLGWTTVADLVVVTPERFEKMHRIGPIRRRAVEATLLYHLKVTWKQARRTVQRSGEGAGAEHVPRKNNEREGR